MGNVHIKIREWVEVIGIIVLTLSLLLVAYEVRLSRDASIAERLTTAAGVEASIRDSIAAHADIWQRGCMGKELTDTERTVFTNLVWMFTYRYFTRWTGSQTLVGAGGTSSFVETMALSIRDYPGFSDTWHRIGSAEIFVDVINSRVAELGSPANNPDPALCGT